jgi:galactose mutarotase-like enzyme
MTFPDPAGLGDVSVEVVPGRGALATSVNVGGRELLYLDRESVEDPARSVRGGIPVLFPFAGKLKDGVFLPAGTQMNQHGFGRHEAWSVLERRDDLLRLGLEGDGSRAAYPYPFRAEQGFRVLSRGLQMELLVLNTGDRDLPLSPGWHPYFACPAVEKANVTGNVAGLEGRFGNDAEFDFGVPPPVDGRVRFQVPGLGALRLEFSPR